LVVAFVCSVLGDVMTGDLLGETISAIGEGLRHGLELERPRLRRRVEQATKRRAVLADLARDASTIWEWEIAPGMALLGSAAMIAVGTPPDRVVAVTVEPGAVSVATVWCGTRREFYTVELTQFKADPLVDLSDPSTFGHLYALGKNTTDAEADLICEGLDLGCLVSSARVIVDGLRDRIPF